MKTYALSLAAMMVSFLFLAGTVAIATDCMTGLAVASGADGALISSRCAGMGSCF